MFDKIEEDIRIVFDKDIDIEKPYEINDWVFEYKNAELLIAYYSKLETVEEKDAFFKVIHNWLNSVGLPRITFVILASLWKYDLLFKDSFYRYSKELLRLIYSILDNWIQLVPVWELWNLKEMVLSINLPDDRSYSHYNILRRKVVNKIVDLRFQNFAKTIKWIDFEILWDQKQVVEYLKDFWFEEKYNITLNKLDKYFLNDWSEDKLIPWWAIWTLREFFKEFYIDIAKKVALYNWLESVPENEIWSTEIWYARLYLKQEFWLSSDEHKLLNAYKDICNNSWSHALLSEKKYLRLARNMWIEISLFLLEKYWDYIG